MTVKALIQELLECPMDAEVILGTDDADCTVTEVKTYPNPSGNGSFQTCLDYEPIEE